MRFRHPADTRYKAPPPRATRRAGAVKLWARAPDSEAEPSTYVPMPVGTFMSDKTERQTRKTLRRQEWRGTLFKATGALALYFMMAQYLDPAMLF